MIHVKTLATFVSMLEDFKNDGVQYKLYGTKYSKAPGSVSFLKPDSKAKTSLHIFIVALSSIGEFYFNQTFEASESDEVTLKLDQLNVIEAKVRISKETNTITIS